jgi:hypothetical protein
MRSAYEWIDIDIAVMQRVRCLYVELARIGLTRNPRGAR